MTTISVPGKITALEVDESGDFGISTLTGGAPASPTTISPSGKPNTIVLNPGDNNTNGNFWFALASAFNVGDVVEIYVTTSGMQFGVKDENGVTVTPNPIAGSYLGTRLRKILTGTPGVPTWGVV